MMEGLTQAIADATRHAQAESALNTRLRLENARLRSQLHCPFEPREDDTPPPWTQEERSNLANFLKTPTGQRLAMGLNYWSQLEEQKATLQTSGHEYACGRAAGFRVCAQFLLHKLSADIQPQSDEDTQPSTGAAALRERNAP